MVASFNPDHVESQPRSNPLQMSVCTGRVLGPVAAGLAGSSTIFDFFLLVAAVAVAPPLTMACVWGRMDVEAAAAARLKKSQQLPERQPLLVNNDAPS